MNAPKKQNNTIREEFSRPVEQLAAKLLPLIAKRKAAGHLPINAGSSFFYELETGWETDLLRKDDEITVVRNSMELEGAFMNPKIKMILVPYYASMTKAAALRICRRFGQGKTVFYEVEHHD